MKLASKATYVVGRIAKRAAHYLHTLVKMIMMRSIMMLIVDP